MIILYQFIIFDGTIGFSRLFDNLSIEIRNKKNNQRKSNKNYKKKGLNVPRQDIKIFCKYLGISQKIRGSM